MNLMNWLLGGAVGLAMLAAWLDLTTFRIPNWISLALVTLFVMVANQLPMHTVVLHFATGVAVLVIGMVLFAWGKVGGGDVKLLAAVSLWFGWPMLATGLLVIGVFGAVLAVLVMMVRRTNIGPWLEAHGYHSPILEKDQGIPYGVAIAAGFIFLIFVPVGL